MSALPLRRPVTEAEPVATCTLATDSGRSPASHDFAHDLHAALRATPKAISPKYFYDETGSRLFDAICELPEYYPTRTELSLLRAHASEMAELMGPLAELVEYGAGSLRKVGLLLDAMAEPAGYVPVDISAEHLADAAYRLRHAYPALAVRPVVADFSADVDLPAAPAHARRRIGFFPGSTLGNFSPPQALAFLRQVARQLPGGALLLGVDRLKAPEVLHAAYNDAHGVTAAFNLNLLERANRELGTDFDPALFAHAAFYNAGQRRIEMHLISRVAQQVTLDGVCYTFDEGETLHTENSYKFSLDHIRALACEAGFEPGRIWSDPAGWFSLLWLQVPPQPQA